LASTGTEDDSPKKKVTKSRITREKASMYMLYDNKII
jgi:hypothetical protein